MQAERESAVKALQAVQTAKAASDAEQGRAAKAMQDVRDRDLIAAVAPLLKAAELRLVSTALSTKSCATHGKQALPSAVEVKAPMAHLIHSETHIVADLHARRSDGKAPDNEDKLARDAHQLTIQNQTETADRLNPSLDPAAAMMGTELSHTITVPTMHDEQPVRFMSRLM